MFCDNGFFMAGMHGFWWIFWLIVVLAILLFRRDRRCSRNRRFHESPHQILQRRLANGEITPEQYEERKRLLDRDAK